MLIIPLADALATAPSGPISECAQCDDSVLASSLLV